MVGAGCVGRCRPGDAAGEAGREGKGTDAASSATANISCSVVCGKQSENQVEKLRKIFD